MFKYWGFGLQITSEIKFPELLPAEFSDADVTIAIGKTPETLEGAVIKKRAFSIIGKDEYLLNIRNICKYYVSYGKTVVAEPAPGMDEQSVRLFLLGTIMGAVLYQRGHIPLHASAIIKEGKLILFAGKSGAGKSTLLAQLRAKGYEIFTDDICVLQQDASVDTGVVGTASYPMIKLWDDAISKIDSELYSRDFKVRPALPKYGQFFYDAFNAQTLPVDKIFILNPKNTAEQVAVKKLVAVNAFKHLEKQAYRHQMISGAKLKTLYFALLSQLTNHVPIYEVNRPFGGTSIEFLSETLIKLF